jgi:hypothetical protein
MHFHLLLPQPSSPKSYDLGSGAGWLGSVRALLHVKSSHLLDVPCVGKRPSLFVLQLLGA